MEGDFRAAEEKLAREHKEMNMKARAKLEDERKTRAMVDAARLREEERKRAGDFGFRPRNLKLSTQEEPEGKKPAKYFVPLTMQSGGDWILDEVSWEYDVDAILNVFVGMVERERREREAQEEAYEADDEKEKDEDEEEEEEAMEEVKEEDDNDNREARDDDKGKEVDGNPDLQDDPISEFVFEGGKSYEPMLRLSKLSIQDIIRKFWPGSSNMDQEHENTKRKQDEMLAIIRCMLAMKRDSQKNPSTSETSASNSRIEVPRPMACRLQEPEHKDFTEKLLGDRTRDQQQTLSIDVDEDKTEAGKRSGGKKMGKEADAGDDGADH